MIEPDGMRNGQVIGYVALPPSSSAGSLEGQHAVVVGDATALSGIVERLSSAGARVTVVPLTADVRAIETQLATIDKIDCMYISFGVRPDPRGTLDTPCAGWERLFEPGCKAAYFYVKLALPKLRQSEQPVVLMEAPAPRCDPDSFREVCE